MVRSAGYRVSKYSAKMVGDVVKNRFDAQHDSMVEQSPLGNYLRNIYVI